jgi:hypothetical protein
MKPQAVGLIDGSWNHQKMDRRTSLTWSKSGAEGLSTSRLFKKQMYVSGRDDYLGSSNGMEVEAMRWAVTSGEDDQRIRVVVTDQASRMAKVIRESRCNVMHEYNANHMKERSTAIVKNL